MSSGIGYSSVAAAGSLRTLDREGRRKRKEGEGGGGGEGGRGRGWGQGKRIGEDVAERTELRSSEKMVKVYNYSLL